MSKTKEQILEEIADVSTGSASRNPTAYITVNESLKAMEEYAQQAVSEYKERLIAEIRQIRSERRLELPAGAIIQIIEKL